jgi:hypothetical protein
MYSEVSRDKALLAISEKLGIVPPLTVSCFSCSRSEANMLLLDVNHYDGVPRDFSIPRPRMRNANRGKGYPNEMSGYAQKRFGVRIPSSTLITANSYNKVADALERYKPSGP